MAPHLTKGSLECLEGWYVCHGQALMQPVALSSSEPILALRTALVQLEGPDPAPASPVLPVTTLSRGSSLLWLLLYPAPMRADTSLLCPGLVAGRGWNEEASSQACSLPMQLT